MEIITSVHIWKIALFFQAEKRYSNVFKIKVYYIICLFLSAPANLLLSLTLKVWKKDCMLAVKLYNQHRKETIYKLGSCQWWIDYEALPFKQRGIYSRSGNQIGWVNVCKKKKGIYHLKVLWALTETNIDKICKNVPHSLTRKSSPVDSGQAVPTSILILQEERNLAKLVIHNVVSPIILEKWFYFTIRIFPKGKMHNSRELVILKLKPFPQRLEIIEHAERNLQRSLWWGLRLAFLAMVMAVALRTTLGETCFSSKNMTDRSINVEWCSVQS